LSGPTEFVAVREGRTLRGTVTGEHGPLVVLVPGLGQGARLFGTLPRRFAREGFRCAVFDPCGIPPSDPWPERTPWSFEAAAEDLLAVARAAREALDAPTHEPAHLVGTSLGGKVAAVTAARDPDAVARLVLLASSLAHSARGERIFRFFGHVAQEASDEAFGEIVAPFLIGRTFLESHPRFVDDLARATRPTTASRMLMQAQARALETFDGRAQAARIAAPTLCLAGREDTLTDVADVEATAASITGAEFEVIERAGHSLLLESAGALDRVLAFLRA
jgi:pimeloyl-ACP methyl ester carboxylesterase